MRYRVYPYKQGSRSARALAEALGGRVLRLVNSRFIFRRDDILINWGSSTPNIPFGFNSSGEEVVAASNKLIFFETLRDSGLTPQFWTTSDNIPEDAYPVVCRTVLNGHSGAGIVIADSPDEVVPARLYVQYKKKKSEFRIHVGRRDGDVVVISEQKKVKRGDATDVDFRIRNHVGGFIFQRNGIVVPDEVRRVALESFRRLPLDFGAVDVIYNEAGNIAYCLEINTAPGLEGQTVTDYANYFRGI